MTPRSRKDLFATLRMHIDEMPILGSVSILVLLGALLLGPAASSFQYSARFFVIAGLLFPALLVNGTFWAAFATLSSLQLLYAWHDSHDYIFIYVYILWIMAVVHSLAPDKEKGRVLQTNIRVLLILVMTFVVIQKLLSPSYLNGSFYEEMLLSHPRFSLLAWLAGVESDVRSAVEQAQRVLKNPVMKVEGNAISIPTSSRIHTVALATTWYILLLQVVVAAAFIPRRAYADRIGHVALLLLIFTGYFAAPTAATYWFLALMGFAIAKLQFPTISITYLLSLLVITLYDAPWTEWLA